MTTITMEKNTYDVLNDSASEAEFEHIVTLEKDQPQDQGQIDSGIESIMKQLESQLEISQRTEELDEKEFPHLSTQPQEPAFEEVKKSKKSSKSSKTKFMVQPVPQHNPLHKSKEEIATTLRRTKPCQFVMRKSKQEEFGVCTREICNFAHSQAELVLPSCLYGDKCFKKNPKKGFQTCEYVHPGETTEDYYKRTGFDHYDLPETNIKTRKPTKNKLGGKIGKTESKIESKTESKKVQPTQPEQPSQSNVRIIKVPAHLAEKALELALLNGMENVEIIVSK